MAHPAPFFDPRQDVLLVRSTEAGMVVVSTQLHLALAKQAELGTPATLKLLPDPALGTAVQALVQVAVAPLRATPSHSAEMLSQVLLGQKVALLEQTNTDWYLIRNWDGYIGYIHREHIYSTQSSQANSYFTRDKSTVFANYAQALALPEPDAEPVFDVSAGCIVGVGALKAYQGVMYRTVYTPDMRMGYLPTTDLLPKPPEHFAPADLLPWARRWLGVPYLWGGTSPRGLDCSGLVQLAGWLCKQLYPRDASQQVLLGQEVASKELADLKPGDLLFFGDVPGRITHVAIYEGQGRYLHASGRVRRNAFLPLAPDYEPHRRHTWQQTRRLSEMVTGT